MRILITGGAGFIGSHLGLSLMRKHEVIFLDNLSFGYKENLILENSTQKLNFINMDIRDPKIDTVLRNIDIVFHFAGISSLPECQNNPKEAYEVNVAGTLNILESARRNNVKRIIFSSTSAVYENEISFPTAETASSRPTLLYSLSKKHAEEACLSYQTLYGLDVVILRFFNVYGPHMDFRRPNPPLISYLILCLSKHEAPLLHSDGNQARDMIYVDDVLHLCEIAMTHKQAKNQIFNVGSGKAYTIKEIYDNLIKIFNAPDIKPKFRKAQLLWDQYPSLFEGSFPFQADFLEKEVNKHTLASTKKATSLLGWKSKITLEEGLKKTVKEIANYSL